MPNIVVEYMSEEKTNKRPQDFNGFCGSNLNGQTYPALTIKILKMRIGRGRQEPVTVWTVWELSGDGG